MRFPTSTVVVALCGPHGSGKDAIASVLSREVDFENFKFARPLKDAIRDLFSLDQEHVDGALKDVVHPGWGITPRALMQWFGTDVMQHELAKVIPSVGRRFWADQLVRSVMAMHHNDATAVAVISDMRFRHELDALRCAFGDRLVAVRVERHVVSDDNTYGSESDGLHESELSSSSLPVDLVISNDGSLAQLEAVARGVLCFGREYGSRSNVQKHSRLLSVRHGRVLHASVEGDECQLSSCTPQKWLHKYALRKGVPQEPPLIVFDKQTTT